MLCGTLVMHGLPVGTLFVCFGSKGVLQLRMNSTRFAANRGIAKVLVYFRVVSLELSEECHR